MISENVYQVTVTFLGTLEECRYYLTADDLKGAVTKFLTQHDLKDAIAVEIAVVVGKMII